MYPFRATYDFECYFTKDDLPSGKGTKTTYIAKHIPLSFSVASNIPGYEDAKCFITDGDPQALVDKLGDYLETLSDHAYSILKNGAFSEAYSYFDNHNTEKEKVMLDTYLAQLPVVGFNNGRYDIAMTKKFFVARFLIDDVDDDNEKYII